MKKEKKKYGIGRVVLWFLLGLLIGAICLCIAFYVLENHTDVDWRTYIEERLIPQALAIIAAVGTVCLALKPAINNIVLMVSSVVDKFKSATDDVNATVTASAKSEATVIEYISKINNLAEKVDVIYTIAERIPELVTEIERIKQGVTDNTVISKLGFGSMIELTKSGASKRIMQIGDGSAVAESCIEGETDEEKESEV